MWFKKLYLMSSLNTDIINDKMEYQKLLYKYIKFIDYIIDKYFKINNINTKYRSKVDWKGNWSSGTAKNFIQAQKGDNINIYFMLVGSILSHCSIKKIVYEIINKQIKN